MLGISGVVPTHSEARRRYLADNVVNNVFPDIEDDLYAALARIKRRHSHEEQYAAHGRRRIDRVSGKCARSGQGLFMLCARRRSSGSNAAGNTSWNTMTPTVSKMSGHELAKPLARTPKATPRLTRSG